MKENDLADLLLSSVKEWNQWRLDNPSIIVRLQRHSLIGAKLEGVNLSNSILAYVDLSLADLQNANLAKAQLGGADLDRANLLGANLSFTDLAEVDLSGADLTGANLSQSNLPRTIFRNTIVKAANFSKARVGATIFNNVSLEEAMGLNHCRHDGPSYLDVFTLQNSPNLPREFLEGCGLTDWQIESSKLYNNDLSQRDIEDITNKLFQQRCEQPIQAAELFISYSHKDSDAVDVIQNALNKKGIRSWRDIHQAESGPLERIVESAMSMRVVLLVLSKNSVASDWVEHEARLARRIAKHQNRDMLCPIALDAAWKTCKWPQRLRSQIEEYNILDFSDWQACETNGQLDRLIKGVGIYYIREE